MTKVILSGCCGKMGHAFVNTAQSTDDISIVCGVDMYGEKCYDFPLYRTFTEVIEQADVIVDFSNPATLDSIIDFAKFRKTACVICTTGYSEEQKKKLTVLSESVPVFFSGNMSLGVNLLIELSKKASAVFGSSFDIEIIEKHHNQKIDAPSGTALMIADGISAALKNKPKYVYDRHSYRMKRTNNEIGIHSVRGGTIVGEHSVIFAGNDEVLTITHQAQSKALFATGAVSAARFVANIEPGMYNMGDMLA